MSMSKYENFPYILSGSKITLFLIKMIEDLTKAILHLIVTLLMVF